MESELLPCPFCGEPAAYGGPSWVPKLRIGCTGCHATIGPPIPNSARETFAAWNRRAPSTVADEAMASELQTCEVCDAPTGRTREDQRAVGVFQPLCELCFELAIGVRRKALDGIESAIDRAYEACRERLSRNHTRRDWNELRSELIRALKGDK